MLRIFVVFCCLWFTVCSHGMQNLPQNNTIHIGQLTDPHTLNPFEVYSTDSEFVASNVYEPLVVSDANGDIVPAQAQSWRYEDGGRRLVFTLREGLQWSNGEPLTADDFVAGFRYKADPANGFMMAVMLSMMKLVNASEVIAGRLPVSSLGVSAPDNRTIIFELDTPVDHILQLLTNQYPLYQPAVKKYGDQWAKVGQMVVNGAYIPTYWTLNDKLELSRNPRYRDADNVRIAKAVLYPLTIETEFKQYEAGILDMTRGVMPGRSDWLKKKFGSQLRTNPFPGVYFYAFNLDDKKFHNRELRQALSYAVDRSLIAERVMGYEQQPARWFVPASSLEPELQQVESFPDLPQKAREAKALALYQKAGYTKEHPVSVEILYNTLDSHRQVALAVADMWKRVLGVKTTLRNMEWNTLSDEQKKGHFEIMRMGWAMGHPNPCFLYTMFQSDTAINMSRYRNAEFDRALDQGCYSHDPEQRRQGLKRMEEILVQDMPIIPLYNYTDSRLVKDRVQGYPRPGQYPIFRIKDLWLKN